MTKYFEIKNFSKYTISKCGKIKNKNGKILKPYITREGMSQVSLSDDNNKIKKYSIHILLYQLFIGEIKEGYYVCHNDKNKLNNNVDNLILKQIKEVINKKVIAVDFEDNARICSRCKIKKPFNEFTKQKDKTAGLSCMCKICHQEKRKLPENKTKITKRNKEYRDKNSEKLKEKSKEYYYNNHEKCINDKKSYYQENRIRKIKEQREYYLKNKDARGEYNKKYHKQNKEVLLVKNNTWKRNKRKESSRYRLYNNMSTSFHAVLKKNKNFKKWGKFVNYTVDELITHLESKFTTGMTWANYGKTGWHVDHIIPQSFFKWDTCDHPAFKACWDLSNLQPLWATREIAMSYGEGPNYIGNIEKNNKVELSKSTIKYLNSINMKETNAS